MSAKDRVFEKATSVRAIMAVIFSIGALALTIIVVIKYPNGAAVVVSNYFTLVGVIVTAYFGKTRPRENPLKGHNGN